MHPPIIALCTMFDIGGRTCVYCANRFDMPLVMGIRREAANLDSTNWPWAAAIDEDLARLQIWSPVRVIAWRTWASAARYGRARRNAAVSKDPPRSLTSGGRGGPPG